MIDPFNGLLASFQLALEAEGKSPKTLDNYSRAVVQLAAGLRDRGLVDDVATITAAEVRGLLVSLQGKVARSTEYRNYSGCRQFFAWCVREGELDVSPMENIEPPKVPEPRTMMLRSWPAGDPGRCSAATPPRTVPSAPSKPTAGCHQ